MINGWVCLHRQLETSEIWGQPEAYLKVWVWCLLRANYERTRVFGQWLERGQFLTSMENGAKACEIPRTTFRRVLAWLESVGMISRKPARKWTIITVCEYCTYQDDVENGGPQVARKWPASGPQVAPEEQVNKKTTKQTNKNKKGETPLPPLPFDSERFKEAWGDWIQHRIEIKKPLKPTSTKQQLRKLEALGEDQAVATIYHTIEKGWQGLREPERVNGRKQAILELEITDGSDKL